ncbi:MAG: endonuclease MutS2 [Prevotellaceae bacterium]|jgi:DNA mismatch repair protein MutS2|nr:endonuclease MutS2 [Prevotellaceae bacterium]
MTYPQNFETKIGFDKIRTLLKEQCSSVLGKEKVDAVGFSADYDTISTQIRQTDEFVRILQEESDFPFGNFYDGRAVLKKARIEGTFLDEGEVFDLRRSLETIRNIVLFFNHSEENAYPYLKRLITNVTRFENVLRFIDQILDKFGKIKDNASPRLSQIRRDISTVQSGISKTLTSILRQAKTDGYVEKDMSPAMREGRLVIPVIPAHKRKIRGIVHDESATGKTVFIEPAEVVEANNRLRELEAEERREIIAILTAFTNFLRPFIDEIILSFDFFATMDLIRAKALFALSINAIKPQVENICLVDWQKARHPVLYLSHQKQQKDTVPLDIKLDGENRILLISGPNAGGKSVCLKTVGLLQYMLQCGLLVPLNENSRMGIFESIFIDIGDEQSIENDLSTYSSHLTNMKSFIRNSNAKTILLIDEFGAGTEPQIGGAIAESLLHQFNENKAFGVITTHYTNLKHYAEDTSGIINGAMLYDRHLMQPLFELQIGNPGSSFAIEIARKIGLPETVIAEATEKVGSDYVNFDKHLQDIVRDKRYWESKRQQIRLKEKQLDEITTRYKTELEGIDKQRKELIRNAKTEAKTLLEQANAKIENTIRQIREAQAEKEQTKQVRKDFTDFKKSLDNVGAGRTLPLLPESKKQPKKQNTEIISIGDNVRLKGQNSVGKILEIKDKTAIVAVGNLKLTVKTTDLEKVGAYCIRPDEKKRGVCNTPLRERTLNFKQEIDVRGMRVDEALQAVMYFIDDALMVGTAQVRILHGTGTGALRQTIRQYLSTVAGVSSFADEHVQLGGAGITVVKFV